MKEPRAEDHIAAREALRAVSAAIASRNFAEVPVLNGTFHLALIMPRARDAGTPRTVRGMGAGDDVAVDELTRRHSGEIHAELTQFIERGA